MVGVCGAGVQGRRAGSHPGRCRRAARPASLRRYDRRHGHRHSGHRHSPPPSGRAGSSSPPPRRWSGSASGRPRSKPCPRRRRGGRGCGPGAPVAVVQAEPRLHQSGRDLTDQHLQWRHTRGSGAARYPGQLFAQVGLERPVPRRRAHLDPAIGPAVPNTETRASHYLLGAKTSSAYRPLSRSWSSQASACASVLLVCSR